MWRTWRWHCRTPDSNTLNMGASGVYNGLQKYRRWLVRPADRDVQRQAGRKAGKRRTKLTGGHKDRSQRQLCREMTDFTALWRSCSWLAVKSPPEIRVTCQMTGEKICACPGVWFICLPCINITPYNTEPESSYFSWLQVLLFSIP